MRYSSGCSDYLVATGTDLNDNVRLGADSARGAPVLQTRDPFNNGISNMFTRVIVSCFFIVTALCALSPADAPPAYDVLPTLAPDPDVLADNDLVRDPKTGQILLRFSNAIGNYGAGVLHVIGYRQSASPQTVDIDDDTMPAFQRVYRQDGTYHDEPIGDLVYHPEHHHFHFVGAARYRLIDPDTVEVVQESAKVSFCLADVIVVDDSVPGFRKVPVFNSCAHDPYARLVQMGISAGWADVYGKDLIGQAFDVTDLMNLPAKCYILESTTNPDGLLWETNDSQPASAWVKVRIGKGVPVGVGKSRPGV